MKILILIRPLHFVSSHILVKKKKKQKRNSTIKNCKWNVAYLTQLLLAKVTQSPQTDVDRKSKNTLDITTDPSSTPTYLTTRTRTCAPPSSRAKRVQNARKKAGSHFSRIGVGKKPNRPKQRVTSNLQAGFNLLRIHFRDRLCPLSPPPPISGQMLRGRDFLRNSRREEAAERNSRKRSTKGARGGRRRRRRRRETRDTAGTGWRAASDGGRRNGTEGWNVRQLVEIAV